MKFILPGEPKSTNSLYKSAPRGRFRTIYMSQEGKLLKEYYQYLLKQQYQGPILNLRVKLRIKLCFKDNRRRDIDNYNKLVLDACTGIIWEDDCQIDELFITKEIDKKNPRIELECKNM